MRNEGHTSSGYSIPPRRTLLPSTKSASTEVRRPDEAGSETDVLHSGGSKLTINDLSKVFDRSGKRVKALNDINLTIEDGEFTCIVGPSGCGKSTLLHIIAGLEDRTTGDLQLHRSPGSDRPANAMIFQEPSALPWMTVSANVGYGLRMRGVPSVERTSIVSDWLMKVGIEEFSEAYPYQLSGGMKQRVSIARAFANDPEMLLMDEPFANLDEQNRILLQNELLELWSNTGKTVVFVTHSIEEAILLGDRIIVMTARPGTTKADIHVDIDRPRDVIQSKANPRFAELSSVVWDLLRDEVLRSSKESRRLEDEE